MQQLYYTLITLIRGKGANLIKIISLSLGLFIGLLLIARITFDATFDTHYKDADKIMRIKAQYTKNGEKSRYPSNYIVEPLPRAILENFPDAVESATLVRGWVGSVFYHDSHRFEIENASYVDSLYFHTMGIDVLSGNPRELGNIDVVFLSESLAKKLYDKENPVGRVIYLNKNYPLTVRGVYKDIPQNSTVLNDFVVSFPTIHKVDGYQRGGWGQDDSFAGFVRLKTSDPSAVNTRMDDMVLKYLPDNGKNGNLVQYFLQPVLGEYIGQEDIKTLIMVMSLLAAVVLIIASMNYVLISISSLNRKSKAIGIHKCSGATNGKILGMFLSETGVLIITSLIIVALLFLNFRAWIEDLTYATLGSLFNIQTLWVPALVILLIFIIVGFLPGHIMARMPVAHVFRRYTETKTGWKKPLLFVQFTGISFIAGLLIVVLMQYHHIISSSLGYNPANVAIADVRNVPDAEFLKDELKRMPMVEAASLSYHDLMNGWGALPVSDSSGKFLFTTRWNAFDADYIPLMEIELAEGRNIDGPGQILINQKFVESMKMQESPVGKPLQVADRQGIVVGVMKDFPVRDRYADVNPVMVQSGISLRGGTLSVRVRELTPAVLSALNKKLEEMYPQEDAGFISMDWRIREQYEDVRRLRDAITLAGVIIVLITLIGLIGYTNDETRRRSKEIAIRKVNGAETANILSLFTRNILWIAIPAVLLGTFAAYYLGDYWIEQFHEKASIDISIFGLLAIVVLALIVSTIIVKVWQVANENPVKSIVSE